MQSLKAKIKNSTKEKVSVEKPFKYGQRFENFMKILCTTVTVNDFKPGTPKSYFQRRDISEEFYHLLIRQSPKDFKAFFYRGLLYHSKLNDMVNAIADYTKSIKINPQYNNVNSYLFRALHYMSAANYILEKRGDELRYIKYANLAFKDLQRLIEMNQYCADAYVLRGVLFMYKFKYHLLFGKSQQLSLSATDNMSMMSVSSITGTSPMYKESNLTTLLFKKYFVNFSSLDIPSLTETLLSMGDNIKTSNNFALIRNTPSLKKILYSTKNETKEKILFYPRHGKNTVQIRSESLLLHTPKYNPARMISKQHDSNKSKQTVHEESGDVVDMEDKQDTIRAILDYVHHNDEQLYRLAEKDFLKAIEINPSVMDPYGFQRMAHRLEIDWYNSYIQLALLYMDLNRVDDAEKYLTESIKKCEKKSAVAYFLRGNIYANKFMSQEGDSNTAGRYSKMAIDDLKRCVEMEPNHYKAWHNLGYLYRIEDPKNAEVCYTKCLELNPAFFTAHYNRGLLYKNILREKEKAIKDFTQAILLDSTNSSTFTNRGSTHVDLGNIENAEADFKKAIEIDPQCSSAYYELAKIYMNDEEKCKYYTSQFKLIPKRGLDKKTFLEEVLGIVQ